MTYEPRGKVKKLVDAMAPRPEVALQAADCARIMGVMQSNLPSHLASAMHWKYVYQITIGNRRYYGLTPNAKPAQEPSGSTDVRIPTQSTATGRTPPKMVCTRPGAEQPRHPVEPVAAPAPAVADTPAAEQATVHAEAQPEGEDLQEEEYAPDAFFSARTGELVLVGLDPDEEGRVTVPADLVKAIRRQIAWMPA